MNRTHLIIVMLTILLGASACDPNPSLDCQTGTEGVTARFTTQTDLSTVRESQPNPAIIEIVNAGGYHATGSIQVTYNEDIISIDDGSLEQPFSLEGGENWNRCQGTQNRQQITITPYELPATMTEFEQDLKLDLCYKYANNLSTPVCISPISSGINVVDPSCSPAPRGFSGGQGGPVSITKVDAPIVYTRENVDQVRIGIHIRNHGNGDIIAPRTPNQGDQACTFGRDSLKNFMHTKAFLDNYALSCATLNPPGGDRPDDDKAYLRYDPETIETRQGTEVLRDYYLECIGPVETNVDGAIQPNAIEPRLENLDVDEPLEMTLSLRLDYYYRDTEADVEEVRVVKI